MFHEALNEMIDAALAEGVSKRTILVALECAALGLEREAELMEQADRLEAMR